MKKYKIKKDTVQETLIIPLYGRKLAMDMYPDCFYDEDCQELFERIDYHFDKMGGMKSKIAAIMGATRQFDMAEACRRYITSHPKACIVNMGCGLDTTFRQVDNGLVKGYNIDFPDAIELRNELLPHREREINIASDLMDFSWFNQIDFNHEDGAVFFASGVFYYLKTEDVKTLLCAMAKHFPGGKIVFDATNAKGLKNMLKTWLEPSDMGNVHVYFSVDDEKTLLTWSHHFQKVCRKGYMSGYRPLDKRYGLLVNWMFRTLEKKKMLQVIELDFKGEDDKGKIFIDD